MINQNSNITILIQNLLESTIVGFVKANSIDFRLYISNSQKFSTSMKHLYRQGKISKTIQLITPRTIQEPEISMILKKAQT
jgi:hypothetical protein